MDDLTAAIAEAVESEAGKTFIASLKEDEGEPVAAVSTPVAGEDPSKVSDPAPEVQAEPVSSGEAAEEVPTVYWGLDLEGVAPDKRAEVIATLERDDGYIKQLQADLAEARKSQQEAAAAAPIEEAPQELTDAELLTAAGYDPEDYEVQNMSKYILPSLRRELALEDKLNALVESEQIRQTESTWNTQLDELEAEFGPSGLSRIELLENAVARGYHSPFEAYAAVRLPMQKEAGGVIAEARRKAAEEIASGSVRPASNSAGEPPVKAGSSLREAVEQAAKAAEKETGRKWRDVLGFDKQ